jgi:hypothetical protein
MQIHAAMFTGVLGALKEVGPFIASLPAHFGFERVPEWWLTASSTK